MSKLKELSDAFVKEFEADVMRKLFTEEAGEAITNQGLGHEPDSHRVSHWIKVGGRWFAEVKEVPIFDPVPFLPELPTPPNVINKHIVRLSKLIGKPTAEVRRRLKKVRGIE